VMLVSAYQRLGLYEAAYGFSRLRTYTHVFLVWIGLLLIATIVLEILHQERKFALAMLAASIGFAASLPLLNVDGFIVRQNIQREINGAAAEDLDAQYFIQLSDDAIPVLADALHSPTLPDSIHQKVAAALACIRYTREQNELDHSWQSFHFARFNADKALASVSEEIDAYKITDMEWPVTVTTPDGTDYSCQSGYYD